MSFARMLGWINCALFVGFGVGFVFFPEQLAATLTDAVPATPSAATDMRATYGGMALGLAIIFGLCAKSERHAGVGLYGVAAVMVCLAAARGLGMLLDGSPNTYMFVLLVAEVAMGVLALTAIYRLGTKRGGGEVRGSAP